MKEQYNVMEEAKSVENRGCSVCAIGAACLADGPIPNFEFVGIEGIFGLWG